MEKRDPGSFLSALEEMDLERISAAALEKTNERISELNVDQLRHGLTAEEGRLKKYRSNKYARAKNEMNPLPGLGNPDFILTGAFTSQIRTEVHNGVIGVHSYDDKAEKLEARDGADKIYGLGADRHKIYVEEDLTPEFMAGVNDALNG